MTSSQVPNHSPPILVLSRKKPHLIFLQILVVLSGTSILINGGVTDVPDWLARAWGIFLIASGIIILFSHTQRCDRERGMHLERGGLSLQAGVVLLYAASLTAFVAWGATVILGILTAIAWAMANLAEVRLISADIKMINAMRAITPAGETRDDA